MRTFTKHYNKDIIFEENFANSILNQICFNFLFIRQNFIVTEWICSADEVYSISILYFTLVLTVFEHLS